MILKKIMLYVFALSVVACNNAGNTTDKSVDTGQIENVAKQESDNHEGNLPELSLNNGDKWQTDESTRTHFAKLDAEITSFNLKEQADMIAYQKFAADMQKELDNLVGDCKMKGADHDALHLWLQPVLRDVRDLKKVNTLREAKQATEKLTSDVRKFNHYFL